MKVLFIGGSGNISSACTKEALLAGHTLYHFNRGISHNYDFDKKVITITGDITHPPDRLQLNAYAPYDVVVNFVGFVPEQIQEDIDFFKGKTRQYIFISSATVYKKPPDHYLITEDCPLENPFWIYAQNKIACENKLTSQPDFPYTIVRPSYTYGKTWIPVAFSAHNYNPVYRIRKGLPLISHGDGESLWVMTHTSDFAKAFIPLFGNKEALRNHYHITSDEVHTWDQIYKIIGKVVGIEPILIHIPSDFIRIYSPEWGAALLGDKARSVVFDNSKIRKIVPNWKAKISFEEGVRESISWFEESSERMKPDAELENKTTLILKKFQSQ
jgi:nucleoside-diphosphate-sugar epimerase